MHATRAYTAAAKETASPRDLEWQLLLKAAYKMQSVHDGWTDKPTGLNEALLYNRRLWTVFLDSVCSKESALPVPLRENIANLGVFVMSQTFALMTDPKPSQLVPLININRELAAGLRGDG